MNHPDYDPQLVIDLGMNNGDDTDYYLRCDFNVIAVEANPFLTDLANRRFKSEIADGRLVILQRAISDASGGLTFFVNKQNDHWSSLDINWATREDSAYQEVKVEAISLSEIFRKHGVPFYLKIDVEGADKQVLEQLSRDNGRPPYVSVEDCRFGFDFIDILYASGYSKFKLFDQSTVPELIDPVSGHGFPPGSSGPFGENVPGKWMDKVQMIETYAHTVRDRLGNRRAPRSQWWDIHAARI